MPNHPNTKQTATKSSLKSWLVVVGWVVALSCLFSLTAKADDYSFKYGMGFYNGEKTGSIKIFSLREEDHEFGPIYSGREAGLWVDNIGDGRRGAAFGKYQLGVKPGPDVGLYAKAFWGVQLQSSTDTQLGGVAQFSQDAGVGIRDASSSVEVGYSHVSSAGIFHPNRGRDFITLSLGVRF